MKILIVGSGKDYAIENFYTAYLQEAGAEVYQFPALKIFSDYYYKSLLNKLIFRTGLSTIYPRINGLLRKKIIEFSPDVVWVFKGMEIFPATLTWIKNKNFKLLSYNPDNPFIFTGTGSGNKNITRSIPLYDFHFTYNLSVKKQLEALFNRPACFLPFGFDVSQELYQDCLGGKEILKTCFLGNPDPQRASFIKTLAMLGIEIDLYGSNWKKFIRHEKVTIHGPIIYGNEFWKMLRRYRVQLNLMRLHNLDSHNMRSFEVPGIGGIMLAPDTAEHRMFFDDEKEIFLFSNADNCADQIKKILSLSEVRANAVRENARNRSVQSGYSYKDRAVFALSQIELLVCPVRPPGVESAVIRAN
jgi:spore maturation protein CgeB